MYNTADLVKEITDGPQFTLLTDPDHTNMARKRFLSSEEFMAAMAAAKVKHLFIESPRGYFQPLIDKLAGGKITLDQYVKAVMSGHYKPTGFEESPEKIARLEGEQILNATKHGIKVHAYDFDNQISENNKKSGKYQDPHYACLMSQDPNKPLSGKIQLPGAGKITMLDYFQRAEFRERSAEDDQAAKVIKGIAGNEKSIIIPGDGHAHTPVGLDEHLGRNSGNAKVIDLFSDVKEFNGYPRANVKAAMELGLDLSQRPDGYYNIGTGHMMQPTAAWLKQADSAKSAWPKTPCEKPGPPAPK
jgi:hypothetical protein